MLTDYTCTPPLTIPLLRHVAVNGELPKVEVKCDFSYTLKLPATAVRLPPSTPQPPPHHNHISPTS